MFVVPSSTSPFVVFVVVYQRVCSLLICIFRLVAEKSAGSEHYNVVGHFMHTYSRNDEVLLTKCQLGRRQAQLQQQKDLSVKLVAVVTFSVRDVASTSSWVQNGIILLVVCGLEMEIIEGPSCDGSVFMMFYET